MDPIYAFDANRFQLGKLCKHGHAWPGTNQSLRRIPYTCVGCTGRKEADWLLSFLDYEAMGWPLSHRLGKLCTGGHRYENLDATLRINRRCKECDESPEKLQRKRDRLAARLASDPDLRDHRRAQQSLWWNNRSDQAKALARAHDNSVARKEARRIRKNKIRESFKAQGLTSRGTDPVNTLEKAVQQALQSAIRNAGSLSVARLVINEQRRYWRENPEQQYLHNRQWDRYIYSWRYKVDPSFRRHECQRNSEKKARNRGNHTVKLCRGDIDARFAEFNNQCAFCGSGDQLIIEHFIPRSKGGPHAIGNILPACHSCNMSKFNHDPEEWYRSRPYFSETRWRKILRVLGKGKAAIHQLPLL